MKTVAAVYIKDLVVGMRIADPVYAGKTTKGVLLIAANTLITDEVQIKRLEKAGVKTVKIDFSKGLDPFVDGSSTEVIRVGAKKGDKLHDGLSRKNLFRKFSDSEISETLISNALLDQRKWEEINKNREGKVSDSYIFTKFNSIFIKSITKIFSKNITSRSLLRDDIIMDTVKEIVHFVSNRIDILRAVVRLNELNEYTFSHSVNTMVLTLSLANFLNNR